MYKSSPLRISQTYLHQIHLLANALDKIFDQILRTHANLTLSQFMLLAAIAEHGATNQRRAAHFVGISPPAMKRQADIALQSRWLEIVPASKSPGQLLRLTPKGHTIVADGVRILDKHLFKIFADSNRQANMMTHINLLLGHLKGVATEQALLQQADNHNRKDHYERSNS